MNVINKDKRKFDAMVIGSGMSGSWAAKEFCDAGLKTLVLERGGKVDHIVDYPTMMTEPWEFDHLGRLSQKDIDENPILSRCYNYYEGTKHFFTKDAEQPYIQEKPFDWIRGYHTGGKSLLWARQTQRWSTYDFEGPARDGFAVEWPISYDDLAPWYSHVEKFAGISGNLDGLDSLPDGEFQKPHNLSCVEKHWSDKIAENYKDRHLIMGRCAHLTDPQPIHYEQGRAKCQHRTICERGCPYGGYFSANASTLPWAMKTGNMTLQNNAVVDSIIYDEKKGRAVGVRVIDAHSKEMIDYFAKIIFVNASALNSNMILLNSKSSRFENGLGNDNGLLGKYVAFHNYRGQVSAEYEGFKDKTTGGNRPNLGYIPRFRNFYKQETNFLRGYATGLSSRRLSSSNSDGIGEDLRSNLQKKELGPWRIGTFMQAETIPKESNFVALDKELKDPFGIPQLRISVDYDDNDEKMTVDYLEQMSEMFEIAGFKNIKTNDDRRSPGLDIHEMGGVRMGKDPKTSLLNKWNQLHHCKNVFVTDGACMTSTSTQNPSLTYMALTARAANYAISELKKKNL